MAMHSVFPSFRALLAVLALALGAAACSSSVDPDVPAPDTSEQSEGSSDSDGDPADGSSDETQVFAGPLSVVSPNSPGTITTTGEQRIMTALIGEGPNSFLGDENHPVVVTYQAASGTESFERDGTWLTTNASALGLYVSYFQFPEPGLWEIAVSEPGGDVLGATLIEVVETSTVPNIGDAAPLSITPTATTTSEVGNISTDLDANLALYDLTIAEAVSNGRPTVVAFATPAFCQTALCGPTLDFVKAATAGRAGIDVVHVEPFDLELAPQGELRPIATMTEWGLLTEPWVFIVDSDGLIAATFEGIVGQAEMEAAIDRLS